MRQRGRSVEITLFMGCLCMYYEVGFFFLEILSVSLHVAVDPALLCHFIVISPAKCFFFSRGDTQNRDLKKKYTVDQKEYRYIYTVIYILQEKLQINYSKSTKEGSEKKQERKGLVRFSFHCFPPSFFYFSSFTRPVLYLKKKITNIHFVASFSCRRPIVSPPTSILVLRFRVGCFFPFLPFLSSLIPF